MGRKPVSDKAIPVTVYIKQSKVDKLGGIKSAREYAESHLSMLSGDEQPITN